MSNKNDDVMDRIIKLIEQVTIGFGKMLINSVRASYLGYRNDLMPTVRLLQFSSLASLIFFLKIDHFLLKSFSFYIPKIHLSPPVGLWRVVIWIICAVSPFIIWGWRRHKTLEALMLYLHEAFTAANLVSNDKTPTLIRDYETETQSRVLQFLSDGITLSQIQEKKEILENKLSVRIESIQGSKQFPKLIEIEFAKNELAKIFKLNDIYGYHNFTFPIGTTRTEVVIGDLKKIPHYLFAGQTGSGKSTFIRTMATVLLANNKNLEAYFIDLKGTEASAFEGLPRLKVAVDEKGALLYLKEVEREIEVRKELFHKAKTRDIEAYNKKMVLDSLGHLQLSRILLIIDEFANLMPTTGSEDYKALKEASAIVNWIARTGRSFGVNLVIGIQKPDTRNMDSTTKANLEGILCFQVKTKIQSQVVLDNTMASSLGGICGRAVWQTSSNDEIVQAPIIPEDIIQNFIGEKKNETIHSRDTESFGALERSNDQEGDSPDSEDSSWSQYNN